MTSPLIKRAALVARIAHKGQMRLQGEPYFHHPERIAATAMEFDYPQSLVAAAYLHDVIEDCGITQDELQLLIGDSTTLDLVVQVTNVAKPEDGNRKARMAINRNHLATSTMWGATLKCLDINDNLSSHFYDGVWARKYFAEKEEELLVLRHADPRALMLAENAWRKGPVVVDPPRVAPK